MPYQTERVNRTHNRKRPFLRFRWHQHPIQGMELQKEIAVRNVTHCRY